MVQAKSKRRRRTVYTTRCQSSLHGIKWVGLKRKKGVKLFLRIQRCEDSYSVGIVLVQNHVKTPDAHVEMDDCVSLHQLPRVRLDSHVFETQKLSMDGTVEGYFFLLVSSAATKIATLKVNSHYEEGASPNLAAIPKIKFTLTIGRFETSAVRPLQGLESFFDLRPRTKLDLSPISIRRLKRNER